MSGLQDGESAALRLGEAMRLGEPARLAGARYWTASLLPALVGTTLPFWLRPLGLAFRWLGAVEFLIATLLFHAGFSLLLVWFEGKPATGANRSRVFEMAGACLILAYLMGLHLSSGLSVHDGVPRSIFLVYGACALFVGALYVAPPFRFYRRLGGEIILCEGLGMLPLLGAYLIQVGDLTRTVYLASFPLVIATALWVWADELATREDDEQEGRRTMVMLFSPRFAGGFITLALAGLLYASIVLAVLVSVLSPWALAAMIPVGLAWKVVALSWKGYASPASMIEARGKAFALHLITSLILAASSLATLAG